MTFEYRISPTDPRMVEIRHKHTHAGRPSLWRSYMLRESPEDALWLLEMLDKRWEDESIEVVEEVVRA